MCNAGMVFSDPKGSLLCLKGLPGFTESMHEPVVEMMTGQSPAGIQLHL